ncbi:MAG: transporter substrate-binding domain-containing protein [Rickettsiales bacterium]|jgi:ABC-type amino acid transport substrate-binding protein|nr:transporter substrate-binding domain-containing protein [Rickettsiales bacterium]
MKKIIILVLIMLSNVLAAQKELVVGVSAIRPPFMFYDADKNLVGYDYEVMETVAKKLGHKTIYKDMQWDGLIPSLIDGKIDVIASALSVNEERKKKINYSDSYNRIGSRVTILPSSNIKSINDLKNKKVGVAIGTVQEDIANENADKIGEIVAYNGGDDSFIALQTGKVEALIENGAQVAYHLSVKKIANVKMVGDLLKPMEMAFGLRKGNDELLKELNKTLAELKKDGTIAKLQKKWFGK